MNIYNISGSAIVSDIPLTSSCELVQELMRSDYVQLSWNSPLSDVLPAGAYIDYLGERYALIEPYKPEQRRENEWVYKPQFVSRFFALSKVPFFMYSTVGGVTTKEAFWTLTDTPANFVAAVCAGILNETGVKYTYAVDNNLQVASATCVFNSVDIISACNAIANAFKTEVWLEKYATADASGNIGCIHLGKAQTGSPVTLQVGVNVKVPSVTKAGEYYNRFYVFGSARNITQDYQGANVNNVAEKRLTLNPQDYPYGYMDFSGGGPVFSKILQFDDIFPSASDLVVTNIRARMRYTLDESTSEKIVVGGTEQNPVYDMYAVWYVQLKRKVGGSYVDFTFNNTTYDKTSNPTGMLLPALVPSFHFNSGPLAGREFEVIYHETSQTVQDAADSAPFAILAGDFEIKFKQEGSLVIPSVTGLVPQTDNLVVLFNVHMPDAYIESAYDALEAAALEEIEKNYIDTSTGQPVDKNSYQVASDPTVFYESAPSLAIGSKVTYVNGLYTKQSRVTGLRKRIDLPCYQTITFGDEIVKGNIEELKEEAVSANRNIDLLAELNRATSEISAAYERTHQLILQQLSEDNLVWQKEIVTVDGVQKKVAKLNPAFEGAYALGWLSTGGIGSTTGGGGGGGGSTSYLNDLLDVSATNPNNGDLLVYNSIAREWQNTSGLSDYGASLSLTTVSTASYLKDSNGNYLLDSNGDRLAVGESSSVTRLNLLNRSGIVLSSVELDIDLANYATRSWVTQNFQATISDLATIRENAADGAAKVSNVQSDWDAASGLAVILNKPDLSVYALQSNLDLVSGRVTALEDLFEIVDGNVHVKNGRALYSDSWIASGGIGSGGGGGGGASFLRQLFDVYHDDYGVLRANGDAAEPGDALVFDSVRGWVAGELPSTYELPPASLSSLGGIKTGYTQSGKNYPVQLDSENNAYVSVPWEGGSGGGGVGTVTSVGVSMPVGLSVSGSPVTSAGTIAIAFASGYGIPTTEKQEHWDTAYGWGNHATAGYVTLSGAQTISGDKEFTGSIYSSTVWAIDDDGSALFDNVNANSGSFDMLYVGVEQVATQAWVQSQGYLTSHQSLANYVTLDTIQTIAGAKTFSANVTVGSGIVPGTDISSYLGSSSKRFHTGHIVNMETRSVNFRNATTGDKEQAILGGYGYLSVRVGTDLDDAQAAYKQVTFHPTYGFYPEQAGVNLGYNGANYRWSCIYGVDANLTGDLAMASTSEITIGPVTISYDATNKALHISGTDNNQTIGLYCDGFVAAGGVQQTS